MRTVVGVARWIGSWVGRAARRRPRLEPAAQVRPLAGGRRPLLPGRIGEQRRGGVRLDQADGTTCGSAVLVALAAWTDPAETARLDGDAAAAAATGSGAAAGAPAGVAIGFGERYDTRQKQVHRQSTRFWPQALGTTPWGMAGWLRRYVPGAGPYRVRLMDDRSAADVDDVLVQVGAALAAGRPVPLLVGSLVPRHYVLALGVLDDGRWRVYEPRSGQVRALDLKLVRERRLAPVLGFDRLHAGLLPS
jgi:hypothetical protein